MVEVTLELSPPLINSVQEIAKQQFNGNLKAALNAAIEYYVDARTQKRDQLKRVVKEIREEVEAQGGLDEKATSRHIREYRRVRYSTSASKNPESMVG
jgi:predicted transcriptional regulator